jgi:hypothetical protein
VTEETRELGRENDGMSTHASSRGATLHGRWLLVARAVWVAVALLTWGVFVFVIPSEFARLHSPCTSKVSCNWLLRLTAEDARELGQLGFSVTFFAVYFVSLEALFTVVAPIAVGAIIFWRRSDNRMAFLVSLVLLTYWTGITFPYHLLNLPRFWEVSAALVIAIGEAAILLFFYTFPDGHFVPRWSRWLALVSILVLGFSTLFPYSFLSLWRYPLINALLSAVAFTSIVSVQIYRYTRVSDDAQRQQTKWVVLGMAAAGAGYCTFLLTNLLQGGALASLIGYTVGLLLFMVLLITIVVATLRYRLYDIDIIINRALVYGSLTATLIALYFGGIIVLQRVFVLLTGEKSTLAVVASTLLIAALFTPLRRRIQGFIDRRFYRRKYDARKTLEGLSAKLRDETDLDALSDDLVEAVRETVQPAHVSLWLRPRAGSNRSMKEWAG